jgi:predicted glycoside hydrolase/deacetylase ChbG (UPF0249 family)
MNIIINADDFGVHKEADNTIIKCHQNGIVTSTSIVSNGRNFFAAVELAKKNPHLGVGVHLTLEGDNNFTESPSSIIDPQTNKFYEKRKILKKLRLFRVGIKDLIREYSKQIEFVLEHDINITHLDHHHHYHLYKPVLDAMIYVAKRYRINFIRSQRLILSGNRNYANLVYRRLHQIYLKRKIGVVDGYFSFIEDNLNSIKTRLRSLIKGNYKNVEIVIHPKRMTDLEVLFFLSQDANKILETSHLISYRHLYHFSDPDRC